MIKPIVEIRGKWSFINFLTQSLIVHILHTIFIVPMTIHVAGLKIVYCLSFLLTFPTVSHTFLLSFLTISHNVFFSPFPHLPKSILHCSTLTRLDEPYPMLVLCGPTGSGQEQFVRHLVDEFPSFFGLG